MRSLTTRRNAIAVALLDKLKLIDSTGDYRTNILEFSPKLKFWDEIVEFPAVHLNPGSETRVYQGGGYRDRFMNITIRCYVNQENSQEYLEALLEDVETVIENNGRLAYLDSRGAQQHTRDIKVLSIETDEGVLDPIGVGEITVEVSY